MLMLMLVIIIITPFWEAQIDWDRHSLPQKVCFMTPRLPPLLDFEANSVYDDLSQWRWLNNYTAGRLLRWSGQVTSIIHRLQEGLSSISSLPLPLDNCVCGKLVIVFNPNWFFLRMKETEFVSRVDVFGNRAQATQNNRVCPLMRIELLLKDRQPQNLHFLNSSEGNLDYNWYYMKGATVL